MAMRSTCFAYPFGAYNGMTQYAVIEAGILMAFDVTGGPQPLDRSIDRWHILRINVDGNGTLDDFIASSGVLGVARRRPIRTEGAR